MKRTLILSLLLVCAGFLFANGEQETVQNFDLSGPGELPFVKNVKGEVPTLTIYTHTRPNVDSFEENEFTKWLEETTGINLDFIVVPEADGYKKLNVLMASGEYPDIITGFRLMSPPQIKMYGEEGVILSLNDLIEKHGVETKKMYELFPSALDKTSFNGQIYCLPHINECYHCTSPCKMWVYKPWLDKLGLDVPTTTQEFEEMLIAFKTQDPNGNGIADEIPLMGSKTGWHNNIEHFLMNSFLYYDPDKSGRYIKDGKVQIAFYEDGWREGYAYINNLVDKGLVPTETWTQDYSLLTQIVESSPHVVGCAPGGWQGMFCHLSASEKWKDYIAIAPLKGPKGVQNATWIPYGAVDVKWMITNKCKYPELAMKLADFLYNKEVSIRSAIGRPGIEWDYLPKDTELKDVDGNPAEIIHRVSCDEAPANVCWNAASLYMNAKATNLRVAVTSANAMSIPLDSATKNNYLPYVPSLKTVFPPLVFNEEEAEELALITSDMRTYQKEVSAQFAVGVKDVNEYWDEYLKQLKLIGIDRMIEIYQAAYDRKYN